LLITPGGPLSCTVLSLSKTSNWSGTCPWNPENSIVWSFVLCVKMNCGNSPRIFVLSTPSSVRLPKCLMHVGKSPSNSLSLKFSCSRPVRLHQFCGIGPWNALLYKFKMVSVSFSDGPKHGGRVWKRLLVSISCERLDIWHTSSGTQPEPLTAATLRYSRLVAAAMLRLRFATSSSGFADTSSCCRLGIQMESGMVPLIWLPA